MTRNDALFTNEAFYMAFTEKDPAAMARLWARHHPTVCVHPGWPALTERDAILRSWESILSNPDQPGMDFADPVIHDLGGTVLVTCYELLPGGTCVATNGFVEEDGGIRMVLHHAGACVRPDSESAGDSP